MKIAGKSLFARFISTVCLCLTLFYAASMGLYMNSAFAAQPPADMATMDCHDMAMDTSQNSQSNPMANPMDCCSTVGCCPMVTPGAYLPMARQFAQPLQLTEWAPAFHLLHLSDRLLRPPRA